MTNSYTAYVEGVASFDQFAERILSGDATLQPGESVSAAVLLQQDRREEAERMFWCDLRELYLLETVPGLKDAVAINRAWNSTVARLAEPDSRFVRISIFE